MFLLVMWVPAAHGAVDGATLAPLVRVWATLKFHHPAVQRDGLDWDAELAGLPARLAVASPHAVLDDWAARLPVVPCQPCAPPLDRVIVPDHGWFATLPDHAAWLEGVVENRVPLEGARYGWDRDRGWTFFQAEPGAAMPVDGVPRAVVAVGRLYAYVEYFQHSRSDVLTDWPDRLPGFLDEALRVDGVDAHRALVFAMAHAVRDGHAQLFDDEEHLPGGPCRLGAELQFVDEGLAVRASSDPALRPGDLIVRIDGVPVEDRIAAWAPLFAGAHEAARRRAMVGRLGTGDCGPAALEVARGSLSREVSALRAPREPDPDLRGRPGEPVQWLGKVAYVNLAALDGLAEAELVARLAGADGVVFDSRDYPDIGLHTLVRHLIDAPLVPYRALFPDRTTPGAWVEEPWFLEPKEPLEPRFLGPIAVLADEGSFSRGEAMVVTLASIPRARVFGSATSGTDGSREPIPLPGTFGSGVSIDRVLAPDGARHFNPGGFPPDVPVSWSARDLARGRDPVLAAALAWIRTGE